MKKKERNALAKYIRALADDMRLRDWTVKLADEPCANGDAAHIHLVYGRKLAIISVPVNFTEQTPEDQRHTIVHELIHAHFESMASMVRNDLEKLLGGATDMLFFDGFKRQYEYGVDGLADAIAPSFPLIKWDAD